MPCQNPFDTTEYSLIVRGPEGQNSIKNDPLGKEQSTEPNNRRHGRKESGQNVGPSHSIAEFLSNTTLYACFKRKNDGYHRNSDEKCLESAGIIVSFVLSQRQKEGGI